MKTSLQHSDFIRFTLFIGVLWFSAICICLVFAQDTGKALNFEKTKKIQQHSKSNPNTATLNKTLPNSTTYFRAPDSEWQYKRSISLNPATPQTDYQIKVELTTSNFDYSHANSDGSDLRFYDGSDTELSYWIENWNPSGTSTIRVKVPTASTTDIFMYYGNSSASSVSNGNNTFEFFDDFSGDLSKWDTGNQVLESNGHFAYQVDVGYNAPHISDGNLIFDGIRSATDVANEDGKSSGWWGRSVKSKNSIVESNFIVETRMWFTQSSTGEYVNQFSSFEVGVGTDKDNYIFGYQRYNNTISLVREVANTRTDPAAVAHTVVDSQWKNIKFTFINNSNCEYKIDLSSQTYSVGQSLSTRKVTLAFDHRAPLASVTQKVDWVFVRKYASSESVTTLGEEITNLRIKYVATNGATPNNGSSWEHAFTTIQAAVDAASAGDTIIVGSSGTGHGEGTYTENVNVNKNLTIRSESGYEYTTVVASTTGDHVFEVDADSVTIGGEGCGFSIYGATDDGMAGIYLNGRTGRTIQGNRCGWDDIHYNYYGIYLSSSNYNTISSNICNSNYYDGICLESSSNNTFTGNTCNSNLDGIYLNFSNYNTFTSNICNSNNEGICLYPSSNSTLTGNTCNSNSFAGISLYFSSNNNTLTDNTCNSNNTGIYLESSNNNTIYLNNLSNTFNVSMQGSTNTWNSPTKIYYDYTSGSFHKNNLGNYYNDYTGSDTDGDGIGTPAYTKNEITDSYPLMATSDHYSLQAWWLNSDSKMYRDNRSKAMGSVTISGGNSQMWTANETTTENTSYSGNDTWTGQIVFTTAPASSENFTVKIGSSTGGSDFTAGGPQATITGDGSKTIFTFETSANAFSLISGSYLAMKLTNNSGTEYSVQTGGAWSYCSSAKFDNEPPTRNEDNILPNQFSLFQNQPNPFSTSTLIRYELPEKSNVTLKVYDVFGREVTTLFEGEQNGGKYEVGFNGANLPGGIYFCQLQAGNFIQTNKLILQK